ncbi:protein serine/threonine phosphatase 2C [Lyophyllum atratum]|nr:protein serine/threonine phosphatase 2C [Lyophyllum atratum]
MQSQDNYPETPSTPGPALDSVNAHIEPITTAKSNDTYGTLNQHPATNRSYQIGISHSQGPRATMEDSYGFVVDFDSIRGQGLFGMFDGHGNKLAAEWCGAEFHKHLLRHVHEKPKTPTPDVLSAMFGSMDDDLSELSQASATMAASGSTAVAAFLRIEDADGGQSFATGASVLNDSLNPISSAPKVEAITPPSTARRVLYCANVGDTRLVICRDGRAERLTYDHKASERTEIDRVRKADGIIFRGRVLGYLNVTRSLGNHEAHDGFSLKKYVVGTPYTSRTELTAKEEFFILACDGLWDVVTDQEAVDLIRGTEDPQVASKILMDHAFENGTRDNVTVMVVRFKHAGAT